MKRHSILQSVLAAGTRFGFRAFALAIGVALMVLGLAMGVSLVMLPFGLVIGLGGVLTAIWALFGEWSLASRA